MFVVPVKGDKIRTVDDSEVRIVTSFTSLKEAPAVYVKGGEEKFLFFEDIAELNGVKVEFDKGSKTFKALGTIKRKYNLPQPGDKVKINLIDVPFKKEDEMVTVDSLKLHDKKYGAAKGMLVRTEKSAFPLSDVLEIERQTGNERFDHAGFVKYYLDYCPYKDRK